MIRTLIPAAAICIAIPSALAAGADDYETSLGEYDGRPNTHLAFDGKDCGGECFTASLDCDAQAGISFTFADIDVKVATAAITREKKDFVLKAGGASFAFAIWNLKYGGEMNGTWQVTGDLPASASAGFTAALAKSDTFKATIRKESITLPVTADVKTWAAACVK